MEELQLPSYLPNDCQMGEIINPVSNQKIGATKLSKKMERRITQNDEQAIRELDVTSKESIQLVIAASDKLPNYRKGEKVFTYVIMARDKASSFVQSVWDRTEIQLGEIVLCSQKASIAKMEMMSSLVEKGNRAFLICIGHKNGKNTAPYSKCPEKLQVLLKNPRLLFQKFEDKSDYFKVYFEEI